MTLHPRPLAIGAITVLLHFELFPVVGYPLTLAPLGLLILLGLTNGRVSDRGLAALLLALALPLLPLTLGLHPDLTQFARTYLLWLVAVSCLAIAAAAGLKRERVEALRPVLLAVLALVCAFSGVQYLAGRAGITSAFTPFGSHTYSYALSVTQGTLKTSLLRARGFYLEPSFNALVITTLLMCLVLLRYHVGIAFAMSAVGLVVSNSATGYLVLIPIALMAYRSSGDPHERRHSRSVLTLVLGIVVVVSGGYLASRWSSLTVPGSSAYYRIVAPRTVLAHAIADAPIGEPFGSLDQFVYSQGLVNGTSVGKSLDNGLYYLIFYFGAYAIAFFAGLTVYVCSRWGRQAPGGRLFFAWLALTLCYTGGVVLPEFIFLLCLAILCARASAVTRTRSQPAPQPISVRN